MAEATKWSDLKWTDRKDKPWLNGLARLIFVSDMSDALSSVIPLEYLEEQVIRTASSPAGLRHHWLWLTKRPERMAQLSDLLRVKGERWPANLWAGTSITSQGTIGRINSLLKVGDDETFRFLSVEPQRERIDFGDRLSALDWVIQGGESGAGATPFELEWASDLIDQCKRADTAYFLKQLGSVVHEDGLRKKFADGHAGDWSEWPMRLRVRELPRKLVALKRDALSSAQRAHTERKIIPLRMLVESKGRLAALKAWATRRENERRAQESA